MARRLPNTILEIYMQAPQNFKDKILLAYFQGEISAFEARRAWLKWKHEQKEKLVEQFQNSQIVAA